MKQTEALVKFMSNQACFDAAIMNQQLGINSPSKQQVILQYNSWQTGSKIEVNSRVVMQFGSTLLFYVNG